MKPRMTTFTDPTRPHRVIRIIPPGHRLHSGLPGIAKYEVYYLSDFVGNSKSRRIIREMQQDSHIELPDDPVVCRCLEWEGETLVVNTAKTTLCAVIRQESARQMSNARRRA